MVIKRFREKLGGSLGFAVSGRKLALSVICVSLSVSLSACGDMTKEQVGELVRNQTQYDRSLDMDHEDYRRALAPRPMDEMDPNGAPIPDMTPIIESGLSGTKPMPLVTISVNQTVPLRDILFELAEQAEVDLELDPNIHGSVIFTARERPFDVVIDRICKMAGLRYKFDDNILRIEEDTPYIVNYKIDFLNIVRDTDSGIDTDISVITGEGADNGSSNAMTTTSESDFWTELETNVQQILNVTQIYQPLATRRDPRATPLAQQASRPIAPPAPAPAAPAATDASGGTAGDTTAGGTQDTTAATTPPQQAQQQLPPPVIQVDLPPTDEDEDAEEIMASFTLNRQAGIVSVFANERQHKHVAEYLVKVRRSVMSQVIIETKVLEVSLEDEYSEGVDWALLNEGDFLIGANFDRPLLSTGSVDDFLQIGLIGTDFGILADFASRFGSVRTLSSPRITVLNNQGAILNVAENRVFFELDVDSNVNSDTNTITITVDSNIRSVPEGILINVLPSIDPDTGMITMHLRPTVTRVVDEVSDPAVEFLDVGVQSLIPELAVQEIDSVLNMRSGEVVIMGGLMQDTHSNDQTGVPILSELPIMGGLFKSSGDFNKKKELVVMLRASIVENGNETVHQTDRDIYRKFSGDRRPFRMR